MPQSLLLLLLWEVKQQPFQIPIHLSLNNRLYRSSPSSYRMCCISKNSQPENCRPEVGTGKVQYVTIIRGSIAQRLI